MITPASVDQLPVEMLDEAQAEIELARLAAEIKHHVSMLKVVDYAIKSFLDELKSAVEE